VFEERGMHLLDEPTQEVDPRHDGVHAAGNDANTRALRDRRPVETVQAADERRVLDAEPALLFEDRTGAIDQRIRAGEHALSSDLSLRALLGALLLAEGRELLDDVRHGRRMRRALMRGERGTAQLPRLKCE